jgi:F-type H+-transporting ATPase subunit gamma
VASIQSLKRRIKSAKNIKQITKAMEMVAASKMRKAQNQAIASRPYSRKLESTLATIATLTNSSEHPLLTPNSLGDDIVILFSTDKALAGSLNSNLFRGTVEYLDTNTFNPNPHFIIVGQKAKHFVLSHGFTLDSDFSGIPDPVSFQSAVPIAHHIIDQYKQGNCRSVTLVYMDFISTLVQKFRAMPLLPLNAAWTSMIDDPANVINTSTSAQYQFEPTAGAILNWLLPYYIEIIIYQTLLETKASEHSARMVAMKNASDSATDIIADLTLTYNKQRQAKITSELLDNTTATLAVS